jgi:hypothetical protein
MKNASKILALIFLCQIGCQKKSAVQETNINNELTKDTLNQDANQDDYDFINDVSFVDFDADTVYYKIDVHGDEKKETFMVTREIMVADSSFGNYNWDNWVKAWDYSKTKASGPYGVPDFLYQIHFFKNKKFEPLAKLYYDPYVSSYPTLKSGMFSNLTVVSPKDFEHEGTQFLRIMNESYVEFDFQSINLTYKNEKWEVFSFEEYHETRYCIDTITYNYDLKYVNFDFLSLYGRFNCKY